MADILFITPLALTHQIERLLPTIVSINVVIFHQKIINN